MNSEARQASNDGGVGTEVNLPRFAVLVMNPESLLGILDRSPTR